MLTDPRILRLLVLIKAACRPPSGAGRIALALGMGLLCHAIFAVAVLAMMGAMFFGLSKSFGSVPWPWAFVANAFLVLQFPLVHSWLLTQRGMAFTARLVPGPYGGTLSTTTYAIIASVQLAALFLLWTPSGIVWYRAEGWMFWALCAAYGMSWGLLMKASFDAGGEVQSGALGWMSLLGKIKPVFPDMPKLGLFKVIRQPIYVAFALTLWTVPVWTPDQVMLALSFTAYCLFAPRLKERRFERRYGTEFELYRKAVPYVVPRWVPRAGLKTKTGDGTRTVE